MYLIEYSALKYYNSVISEECLYIGIMFNNVTTGQRDFKYISNFNRFQSFDDEADVSFVRAYLNGIKADVENNILNFSKFKMSEYTRHFVNEFRFSDVKVIEIDENENYVDELTKLYLKYDFNKERRLRHDEEKKLIHKILISSNLSFSKPQTSGEYQEEISFDYLINNLGVKFFSLKDKNLKKVIPYAKQWSFTAEELEYKMKIIFLYDYDSSDEFNFNIILNILKKHAIVMPVNNGLDYILKASS